MTNQDERTKRAREAVRRVVRNLPWLFSKAGNRQFFRARWEVKDVEFLLMGARAGDKDLIEILRKYAAGARKAGLMRASSTSTPSSGNGSLTGRLRQSRGLAPKIPSCVFRPSPCS